MWKTVAGIVLIALGAYVALNLLITTDLERVEAETDRLMDLARTGGEGAAAEILDAFADDYRGEGSFSRERIEQYLRQYLDKGPLDELTRGDIQPVWKGEEILVPILRLDARKGPRRVSVVLRVTWAERDGRFRIVNVGRWRLER